MGYQGRDMADMLRKREPFRHKAGRVIGGIVGAMIQGAAFGFGVVIILKLTGVVQ